MPVFSIETPSGKILDIEAGTEADAMRGAHEWQSQNSGGLGDKLKKLWDNPSSGPSLVGAAKLAYDKILGATRSAQDLYAPQSGELTEEDAFARNAAQDRLAADSLGAATFVSPVTPSLRSLNFIKPQIKTGEIAPPQQPLLESARDLNVSVPRVLATDSRAAQRLGASIGSAPAIGEPIRGAVEKTVGELGSAAADIAKSYGSGSREIAGGEAKGGILNFINRASRDAESVAHNAVKDIVDPAKLAPLTNAESTLNTINLRRNLGARGESDIGSLLKEGLSREGLSYEGIKDLRSSFGSQVRPQLLARGLEEAEIKQVYGALTKDLESAVYNSGGDAALVAWKEANAQSRLMNLNRKALEKIVGPTGDVAPEAVFEKLVAMAGSKGRADHQRLLLARSAVGKGWDEIASAAVMRMGRDADGKFSPDRYLTAFGNFSDVGKRALFESADKPGLTKALNDLRVVSEGIKDKVGRFQNTSKTTPTLLGAVGLTGLLAAPLLTLSTALGGYAMARVLAEPVAVRVTTNWLRASERVATQPGKGSRDLFIAASRNLALTINQTIGGDVGRLTQQIQSIMPGRPDDDGVLPQRERQEIGR